MHRVQISESKNGMLTFDLKDVVFALPEIASDLAWYVLEIEAVGRGLDGESILETELRVESSAHGIKVRVAELRQFAENLEQTVNATIVGMKEADSPPSFPLRLPFSPPYIALEAIDSSEWAVTSSEVSVVSAILERFPDGAAHRQPGDTSPLGR